MISEEDCWNILGDNFKNKGFVHHQTESFDNFINVGLPRILCEEPPIVIIPDKETKNPTYKKYTISFSDVHHHADRAVSTISAEYSIQRNSGSFA